MLAGVLPTRFMLKSLLKIGETKCLVCLLEEESGLNIFKDCEVVNLIAFGSIWQFNLRAWKVNSIRELLSICINPSMQHRFELQQEHFTIFFANLLYIMWNVRNDFVFAKTKPLDAYVRTFNRSVLEHIGALSPALQETRLRDSMIWRPPPAKYIKVNVDAAYKSEKASLACAARDHLGNVLCWLQV